VGSPTVGSPTAPHVDLPPLGPNVVSEGQVNDASAGRCRHFPMTGEIGSPLDQENKLAEAYANMTEAAVREAFALWVRPEDLAVVVKGP
jgi:hypothetical protein